MLRIIGVCLVTLFAACKGGNRLFEGGTETSESQVAATETKADSDIEEEEEAFEPIAIGGASLVCQYKPLPQGGSNYEMDCGIAPETAIKNPISKAEFFKINSQGERIALQTLQEDLVALKWTLRENAGTILEKGVEVVLNAKGFLPVTLQTTLDSGVPFVPTVDFWLGGEPTNSALPGAADEDCVEFGNLAEKNDRQNFTGLITGPYGRLNDVACTRSMNFLCRNIDAENAPKWVLSTLQGPWLDNAKACPAGYAFGAAATEGEVAEVSALIDTRTTVFKIWVHMDDRAKEGEFVAHF